MYSKRGIILKLVVTVIVIFLMTYVRGIGDFGVHDFVISMLGNMWMLYMLAHVLFYVLAWKIRKGTESNFLKFLYLMVTGVNLGIDVVDIMRKYHLMPPPKYIERAERIERDRRRKEKRDKLLGRNKSKKKKTKGKRGK